MNKIATLTLTVLMLSTVCHFPAAGSRTSAGSETALSSPQRETVYSGKVIDSRTKEPLIGAGVILRDQRTVGVATDLDGSFSISVPDGVKPVFEVSYINYESTFISPSRTSGIVVELEPSSTLLDEVQVIAYGSQRKVSITGSISSINQEELLKSPSGSIANSLAGALTGISSVQVSGQPGAEDPTIYVRGSSRAVILPDGSERDSKHNGTEGCGFDCRIRSKGSQRSNPRNHETGRGRQNADILVLQFRHHATAPPSEECEQL